MTFPVLASPEEVHWIGSATSGCELSRPNPAFLQTTSSNPTKLPRYSSDQPRPTPESGTTSMMQAFQTAGPWWQGLDRPPLPLCRSSPHSSTPARPRRYRGCPARTDTISRATAPAASWPRRVGNHRLFWAPQRLHRCRPLALPHRLRLR